MSLQHQDNRNSKTLNLLLTRKISFGLIVVRNDLIETIYENDLLLASTFYFEHSVCEIKNSLHVRSLYS